MWSLKQLSGHTQELHNKEQNQCLESTLTLCTIPRVPHYILAATSLFCHWVQLLDSITKPAWRITTHSMGHNQQIEAISWGMSMRHSGSLGDGRPLWEVRTSLFQTMVQLDTMTYVARIVTLQTTITWSVQYRIDASYSSSILCTINKRLDWTRLQ